VFGCDGRLQAPNDLVVGPIARSLCAALHRSTLGYVHVAPTYDAGQFYTRPVTDFYSKAMHANMADGRAYGFAFDDVGNFESLVHDGDPRSAGITIAPFGSPSPPGPPPSQPPPTGTWAPDTSYAVGAVVMYGGLSYRCQQTHTSLVGWEPPNVPALWVRI
jgi:hypothetical protein